MNPREQMFDVSLASVLRGRQQLPVIFGREMRSQQPHDRQAEGALRQQVENDRKASRRAGCLDPAVGRVLREMENLRAVREERRASFAQVESPSVQTVISDSLRVRTRHDQQRKDRKR